VTGAPSRPDDDAPLRVLLVDDEPLARVRLRQLLAQGADGVPAVQVVDEAGDAAGLLQALERHPDCDLVLLDIGLPGGSGLALADRLRRLPAPPAVVFVTAHAHHALQAFDLDAVDYLTKPVRRERLQAALQRVARWRARPAQAAEAGPVLVVSDRGRVLRVPVAEVLYLKADQKYVLLVSRQGRWLLDDALADLEQRLGPAVLRVHRSALVAVAAVRSLERAPLGGAVAGAAGAGAGAGAEHDAPADAGAEPAETWVVRLSSGDALAVSRRQLAAVREVLAARG